MRKPLSEEQKARAKAYLAEYTAKNAEKLKQQRIANTERRNETTRLWREANKDRIRATDRANYARDPSRKKNGSAKYRAENPEKVKASLKSWGEANKDVVRHHNRLRKARERGAEGSHSKTDVKWLYSQQKGLCSCCKTSLKSGYHVDHVFPIAKGGSNNKDNLQLLCPFCNSSKGAKHPIDFMQQKGFLL